MNGNFFKLIPLLSLIIAALSLRVSWLNLKNSQENKDIAGKNLVINCQSHPELEFCSPLIPPSSPVSQNSLFLRPEPANSPDNFLFLRPENYLESSTSR